MLLCEVVTPPEEQIESWFKSVNDYVIDNKSSSDFEVAIRKLLYVFPKCKYTGDLYRILNLDKNMILQNPTPQGIDNLFAQYKKTHKRNLYGWSKDLDSAEVQFLKNDPQKIGVACHQYHVGVDVGMLYDLLKKNYPNLFVSSDSKLGFNLAKEENEVISATSEDAKAIQLYVRGKVYSMQELPKISKL